MKYLLPKECKMRTVTAIVVAMGLSALAGCQSSGSRGGTAGTSRQQGFTIAAPTFDTNIHQGEVQTVTVSIVRDDYFKQGVNLALDTTPGLALDPATVLVKADDKPDVKVRITASKEAAFGEYQINVNGIAP
jgi:hypothetical protein